MEAVATGMLLYFQKKPTLYLCFLRVFNLFNSAQLLALIRHNFENLSHLAETSRFGHHGSQ